MTFFKSLLTFSVFKNNLYWTKEQLEKLFSLTWLWSFQLHCDPGKMWFGFQRSWCSDDWRLDDSFHQTPWLDPQSALPLPGPQGQAQKTADLLLKKQQQKSPDKRTVWKQYFTTRCRSFITMRLHVCVHTAHPPSLTPDISPPDWDFPVVFSAAPSPSPVAPSSPGVCRFSCCLNRCRYLSLAHPGSQHPSLSSLVQGP